MSHHGKHHITDSQYTHLRLFLTDYAEYHGLTFADMSRQANMGDGSIASVVRNRKPSRLFTRRLMQAFDATEEQILGPPEPISGDVPGALFLAPAPQEDLLGIQEDVRRLMQDCLQELQGMHFTLQQSLGVIKDMYALNIAIWEYTKEMRNKVSNVKEPAHARIW